MDSGMLDTYKNHETGHTSKRGRTMPLQGAQTVAPMPSDTSTVRKRRIDPTSATGTNDNACHPPTHLKGLHNNVNSNGAATMEGTHDNASQPPASNYEPTKITTQHHKKRRTMKFGSQRKQTGSHIRSELHSNFVGFLALVPLRKIMIIDDKLTYPNRSAMPGLINGFHKRKQDGQMKLETSWNEWHEGASRLGFLPWGRLYAGTHVKQMVNELKNINKYLILKETGKQRLKSKKPRSEGLKVVAALKRYQCTQKQYKLLPEILILYINMLQK
ncbi:metal-nicotianamine transporter YSL3 [Artemisia annua]|uniref:Metal-nicotianamine transporter YSL3 n=1 Tax=Artemisia annua TaxID=35608 RepID=A0A2U1NCH7_ARTAN|nr:metal-nicotianamine transporter YSL3 [Artemisia annua]